MKAASASSSRTFLQLAYALFELDPARYEIRQTQLDTVTGALKISGVFTIFTKDSGQQKFNLSTLELLERASDQNTTTLEGEDFSGLDLSGGLLKGLTFNRCDFSGSRIIKADLSGSSFNECEFSRADLSRTRFGNSRFENCSFQQARLNESFGIGALFDRCDLSMCDVWQAAIPVASFNDCWGAEDLQSELDYRA